MGIRPSGDPGMSDSLDATDRRILAVLTEDARTPMTNLARRVGVARSTVQVRLARLEATGVIAGYTIRRPRSTGADDRTTALVSIVVESRRSDGVVADLGTFPEVRALHTVSGAFDLVALVRCTSTAALDRTLDRIGALPGVARTTSSVILTTRIDRDEPPR